MVTASLGASGKVPPLTGEDYGEGEFPLPDSPRQNSRPIREYRVDNYDNLPGSLLGYRRRISPGMRQPRQ